MPLTTTLKHRVLGLDVGSRRIGIAVSDPLGITAHGLETLQRTTIREDIAALQVLAREHEVKLIFVNVPNARRSQARRGICLVGGRNFLVPQDGSH